MCSEGKGVLCHPCSASVPRPEPQHHPCSLSSPPNQHDTHTHTHIHIREYLKCSHHPFPRGHVLLEHRKLKTLLEGNQRRYDCILKILDLYQSNKRYERPHKSSQRYTSSNTEITSTMTINIITTLNTSQQ